MYVLRLLQCTMLALGLCLRGLVLSRLFTEALILLHCIIFVCIFINHARQKFNARHTHYEKCKTSFLTLNNSSKYDAHHVLQTHLADLFYNKRSVEKPLKYQ